MKLFEGAYDRNVEDVRCILDRGVPVDVTKPVRYWGNSVAAANP